MSQFSVTCVGDSTLTIIGWRDCWNNQLKWDSPFVCWDQWP